YEKSPRNMKPAAVREIVDQLPANLEKVGVFVAGRMDDYVSIIHEAGLTASQTCMVIPMEPNSGSLGATAYGAAWFPPGFKNYCSMPASYVVENGESALRFISGLDEMKKRFLNQPEGDMLARYFQTVFVDSSTLTQPGGTGQIFDWQRAA